MITAEVEGVFVMETPKAVLVDLGDDEHWIPKSLIENVQDEYRPGQEVSFDVAEWFAIKEGFV